MRILSAIVSLTVLFSSCNKEAWADEIQDKVNVFNRTAKEKGVFVLESNSSTEIFLTEYEPRYGVQKIKTRHLSSGLLHFERHFFFRDSLLIYAHYVGVAPQSKQGNRIKFLVFNRQYFWKNENEGLLFRQQGLTDSFLEKKEVIAKMEDLVPEELKISNVEYSEIEDYLEEINSFDRTEILD